MGMLIEGQWHGDADLRMRDGAFVREPSALPKRSASEIAEHLGAKQKPIMVVSLSCPWSHRTTLVRALKGIEDVHVVVAGGPRREGYALGAPNALLPGPVPTRHLHQLYTRTDPTYTGRATVPLLWDPVAREILSNDSASIARGLDAFSYRWRLVPETQIAEIDALNTRIYNGLSNAVYRAGWASTQNIHDAAIADVFATLDWLELRLRHQRCLLGNQITEADLFLFATLARFDSVYVSLFRCTRRRLVDYPALWAYARDVYSWPGVADTIDFVANLEGYFLNDTDTNPHGIVPGLPEIDWREPHGRDALGPLCIWQDGALVPLFRQGLGVSAVTDP
ncbi:MAG: glutathione S-transferase C-terminal domain-containing protein [Pseudomonadota bacterium]